MDCDEAIARYGAAKSAAWVARLSSSGSDRDAAAKELHVLLLRAARFEVRRRAWRGREIPLVPASWPVVADGAPSPDQHAEARDLLGALREEVERLTARQQEVFVAITTLGGSCEPGLPRRGLGIKEGRWS